MERNEPKGTVFDIRRFSTHDGSGIRTTVFLKGCPLTCVWCHNPEGISTIVRPLYFPGKCIRCKSCITAAEHGGVYETEAGIALNILAAEDWEEIIDICPSGAIVWDSRQMTVTQVVAEVLRDRPFYRDGGGVTLSGGEPLLQSEFCLAVLKELHRHRIHTAIETALQVPGAVLQKVLPYLDLIYADCKLYDTEDHRTYAGRGNDLIMENIELLLQSGQKDRVIIRTPLIPGITAKRENIEQISRCISGLYSEVTYEILNYNPLAEAKYHLVDLPFYFEQNPRRFTREEMLEFGEYARAGGVKHIIIES